jgi:cytidine deaminase
LDRELIEAAVSAMRSAYAPYSQFSVGAAVRADDGRIYAGCNVENAAYPLGNCAETSAIAAMVMGGASRITAVAVAGDGEALVTPCGGCRQRISEFAAPDVPIYVAGKEGHRATFTLQELLPQAFGPENLS